MLDSKNFDLWADGYDESVGLSDEENTYPFAGYKDVLNAIYKEILESSYKYILDIGFGTATLTNRLYGKGLAIYGQDFSEQMIKIAQIKMPDAKLFSGDFTKGLVGFLKENKYDAIIATYSLHHLTDYEKIPFIKSLVDLLNPGGKILIGDVAFKNRDALEACKEKSGDYWDDEEYYFVYDELKEHFNGLSFEKYSFCAGVLTIRK